MPKGEAEDKHMKQKTQQRKALNSLIKIKFQYRK